MVAHGKGYQSERVIINVTPEQVAAVKDALEMEQRAAEERLLKRPSENDILLWLLQDLCEQNNIPWPEHIKVQGQRGKDGKFTKSS